MQSAAIPPWETVRRFRHAFLLAFATRIGERLRRATAEVAEGRSGHPMTLVLQDRAEAVSAYIDAEFPSLRRMTRPATRGAGG